MPKKRKAGPSPDDLHKLSNEICALWSNARTVALEIVLRSHIEQSAPKHLIETINRELAAGERNWKRGEMLFLFERSYSATHDQVLLLDGEYSSYHDRALKLSHSFLLRLLSHEQDKLPVPECIGYVPPAKLTELDLQVAAYIVELFREELLDKDYLQELSAETSAAANLLVDSTGPIPAEFRTITMTKRKAAALLGRPNPDSGVRWLNDCIRKGVIRCEQLSRQGFVFDIRQFPKEVHDQLRPRKTDEN